MKKQPTISLTLLFKEQPPAKYKDVFIEDYGNAPGWLWSQSTSGEGAEQQDTYGIYDEKPFPKKRFISLDDVSYCVLRQSPFRKGKLWYWKIELIKVSE